MPFSFVPVPSVRDRVNEAFASMTLAPETYKHFYSFLLFSFSEGLGMDGDGNRARLHDEAMTPRLEHIVRAVKEALHFADPARPLSEELLTAIAQRDTPDFGLKGTAMLSKYPDASTFLYGLQHIYAGFKRVNGEPIPTLHAYTSAGPEAQFLVQLHALDVGLRTLLKVSDPDSKMTAVDKSLAMNGVNRYRPLMGAIDSAMSRRYRTYVAHLDADMKGQKVIIPAIPERGVIDSDVIIPMDRYKRGRDRRLVKT